MCLGVCQWGMMSLSPPEREEDVSLFGIISAEPTERAELLVTIPHRKKTKKNLNAVERRYSHSSSNPKVTPTQIQSTERE